MKTIILTLTLITLLFCNDNYSDKDDSENNANYQCDGREYCSQMTSCEEATFFINNCPNTKMDGNHDGVPCERQWCH